MIVRLIVYNSLSVNEIELMKLKAKVIEIRLEVKWNLNRIEFELEVNQLEYELVNIN